jgi:uncharacterized membrane protein
MNLDLLPLGWVHFLASLAAIAFGLLVLICPKGTPVHRMRGRMYAAAIVLTCVTALGIYRTGRFFFPHWFAAATLIVTAIGVASAHWKTPRTGWRHLHPTCMLASLYILLTGAVNELFLRVSFLRRLAPDFFNSPVLGAIHLALLLLFVLLIAYVNVALLLRSRAARLALGQTIEKVRHVHK